MKAEELRKGNLVWDINKNRAVEFVCLDPDAPGGRVFIRWVGSSSAWDRGWPMVDIGPIPLTRKWLIDLGFTRNGKRSYHKTAYPWTYLIQRHEGYPEGYVFFIDMEGEPAPPSVAIRYVHQLQNLYFALTGEELKLNTK